MATTLSKITRNYQVTIPPAARRALKLKIGDFVEATPQRDGVLLRPARVVTQDTLDQEVNRRLAEGIADLKAGRTSGPFENAKELIDHLHRLARRPRPRKRATKR